MTTPSHTHVASPARRPLVRALGLLSRITGWVAGKASALSLKSAGTSWNMTHRIEHTVVLDTYLASGAFHTSDGTWCDGLLEINPNIVAGVGPFPLDEETYRILRSAASLEEAYDHLPPQIQFVLVFNGMVAPPAPLYEEPRIEIPDDLSFMDDEEDEDGPDHVLVSLVNPGVCRMDASYHRDGTLCAAVLAVLGVEHEVEIDEEGSFDFPEMTLVTRLMAAETPGEALLVTENVEG